MINGEWIFSLPHLSSVKYKKMHRNLQYEEVDVNVKLHYT